MTSRLLAPVLLLATGCATGSSAYLARVNDEVITGAQLRAEFGRTHQSLEKLIGEEKEVRKFLDRLVDRRLFIQEGYRIGLHETAELRDALAKYRAQKLVERLLEVELDEKAKAAATDDEVRRIHASLPDPIEVRQVVVATQAEAEAARARIVKGADVDAVAREKSIAPTAKHGGTAVIAWGGDPAYERILFDLKDGELSPVFRSDAGWEVVKVEKRMQAKRPELASVGQKIRRILEKRARQSLEEALYAGLWSRHQARTLECAPTPAALRDAVAKKDASPCATWSGGAITTEALAGRVKLEALEGVASQWPEMRKLLIEDLVNRELLRAEAEAQGYGQRPEIVEKVSGRQDELVESHLFRDYVTKGIAVTEADVRRFYDENPATFTVDVQLDLAHVQVDTEELAREVEGKLKARQPFAELAAQYSRDPQSAAQGGRIGLFERKRLKDELAPIASLEEGQVSGPIKSKAGWHLVKVLGVKPAFVRPFEEVKEEARVAALDARRGAAQDRWVKTLREAARIEISDPGIRAFSREQAGALRKEQEAVAAEVKARKAREEAEKAKAAGAESVAAPTPPVTPPTSAQPGTPPAPPALTP